MSDFYIGAMSGTSLDGADVVLVALNDSVCELVAARTTPFPETLSARLRSLAASGATTLPGLGTLDTAVGRFFGDCILDLLADTEVARQDVRVVGYSGHTVFHQPDPPDAFTMQLGDPSSIAAITRIDTIADFRRMDVAHGGQGAPLTSTFHSWRFGAPDEVRVVLNLGGVANITILDPHGRLTGFDTGPANSLIDAWCGTRLDCRYDNEGSMARGGTISATLLNSFLDDPFFAADPPKSTGFERFNLRWVENCVERMELEPADPDMLATLTELTAVSVGDSIESFAPRCVRTIVCGGGAYNRFLMERLQHRIPACRVESSAAHGIAPEWVEAIAFAWLARRRIENQSGNAPSVTGARQSAVLGGLYSAAMGD